MSAVIIRAPLLNPRPDGTVEFVPDGALVGSSHGLIEFVGPWQSFSARFPNVAATHNKHSIACPAFLDAHIHIPQHPIRGRFTEGIEGNPPEGRLLAGLNRNVFPVEAKCSDEAYTAAVLDQFQRDTLAKGVIGGSAYMTVHARAAAQALAMLPASWHVGMVLMNQNCPDYLRTDEASLERDIISMHRDHGSRVVVTDRFAVAVNSNLRQRASRLAREFHLRTQTHVNEQRKEKAFVEGTLHPGHRHYCDVYLQDGLLAHQCILAHCVHMRDEEWAVLKETGSVVAHCPTSNTLLGSGIMRLDALKAANVDYALCTDVGASPTTSLLNEMAQFLKVHAGRSIAGTASEALYRTTLAPARLLGYDRQCGSLEIGKELTYVEIEPFTNPTPDMQSEAVIRECVLGLSPADISRNREDLDSLESGALQTADDLQRLTRDVSNTAAKLENRIRQVTVAGKPMYNRS